MRFIQFDVSLSAAEYNFVAGSCFRRQLPPNMCRRSQLAHFVARRRRVRTISKMFLAYARFLLLLLDRAHKPKQKTFIQSPPDYYY